MELFSVIGKWLLLHYKLLLVILVFIVNFLSAIGTIHLFRKISENDRRQKVSIANCLMAGIFLAVIFFLQVPEMIHAEMGLQEAYGFHSPVSLGFGSMILGMLCALVLDFVGKHVEEYINRKKKPDLEEHELTVMNSKPTEQDAQKNLKPKKQEIEANNSVPQIQNSQHDPMPEEQELNVMNSKPQIQKNPKPKKQEIEPINSESQIQDSPISNAASDESDKPEVQKKEGTVSLKYILFCILMSVHALAESLPLGYKKTISDVVAYFIPLVIHKILEAMGVAFAGINEQDTRQAIVGSFIHSAMTPLGALFGTLLGDLDPSQLGDTALLVVMGTSTGVMLHITVMELYVPEMKKNDSTDLSSTMKFVSLLVGLIGPLVIAVINEYVEEALEAWIKQH